MTLTPNDLIGRAAPLALALCLSACASSAPILPRDQSGVISLGEYLDQVDTFIQDAHCLKYDDHGEPVLAQCPASLAALVKRPTEVKLSGQAVEHNRGFFAADLGVKDFAPLASTGYIYLHDTLVFGGARYTLGKFEDMSPRNQRDLRVLCDTPANERPWVGVVEEIFVGCAYRQIQKASDAKDEIALSTTFEREMSAGAGTFLVRDPEAPWTHEGRTCDQKVAVGARITLVEDLCRDHTRPLAPQPCEIALDSQPGKQFIDSEGLKIQRSCDSLLGSQRALITTTLKPSISAVASQFKRNDASNDPRTIELEVVTVGDWKPLASKSWSWNGQDASGDKDTRFEEDALYGGNLQFEVPVQADTGEFSFQLRIKTCTWGKQASCSISRTQPFKIEPIAAQPAP